MLPHARSRVLIAALVLPVAFLMAWNQVHLFRFLLHRTETAKYPFAVRGPGPSLYRLETEATAAGLEEDDLLREVAGRRMRGEWDLAAAIRGNHGGDRVTMTLERAGAARTIDVELPPTRREPADFVAWLFDLTFLVVTPWFAFLLGTFVVWLRPRDPLAWLLLGLMTGFVHVFGGFREGTLDLPRIVSAVAAGTQTAFGVSWSLFMMLFGLYFPDRDASGRLARWSRRILVPLLLALMVTLGVVNGSSVLSFSALHVVERKLEGNRDLLFGVVCAAIAVFFASISRKAATASPDDRRRLKLLLWGAGISTTPTALLVLYSIVTKDSIDTLPPWVFMPVLLLLLGFPLTLAYVIVVQRAMDVRVVVREGLKYALAKRGVRVAQVVIGLAVAFTVANLASDPTTNRPQRYRAAALGVLAVVLLEKLSGRTQVWIDQKFFREAVDAERMLGALNDRVRTISGRETLLQTVAGSVSEALHVPKIAVLLPRGPVLEPAYAIGYGAAGPSVSIPRDSELARKLVDGREPVDVFHDESDVRVQRDAAIASARPQLLALDAALLIPLTFREKLLGFLSLGPRKGDAPYTRNDKHLLASVASQTALALENTDLTEQVAHEVAERSRYLRDLEIAREVQERLYPQAPPVPDGIACAGHCRPAKAVGGDYYDLFSVPGGHFGIAIGDISGKGIPAALLMASLQAYLRGLTLAEVPDPARLMQNINRLILESTPDNRYATFFYGQYDPSTRTFTYVNGGHTAPFVFRATGQVERLRAGGPVVGLIEPVSYEKGTLTLERGDVVVMYTDGLSEAMNPDEEEFGEERLAAVVRAHPSATPSDLISALVTAADAFAAGAPQHDDMTVLVVRAG